MSVLKVQRKVIWEGEVEAMQFTGTPPDGTNAEEIMEWVMGHGGKVIRRLLPDDDLELVVRNPSGAKSPGRLGYWLVHHAGGDKRWFSFMTNKGFLRHYMIVVWPE